MMNLRLAKHTLSAAITTTLISCGGGSVGGGDIAGIGGSGFISSGSISGFGSVFVNGVKFETGSASFDVDGNPGTEDDLAIGMIVQVSGSINDDGITGTAINIVYDDELQGPVSGVVDIGLDGIKRSITVLGTAVILDSGSTTFDVSGDLPANTAFGFDTIAINNNVEVSGFFDSNGDIQATRVELKEIDFDVNSIVEVKGTITNLSGTNFELVKKLDNLKVDASTATLDDLPNGLVEGVFVEVKGTLDTASNTLKASKVEAEDDEFADTDEFELEGIITDYVDDSNFMLGGIKVDASNAQREPASLTLANDARVEVEGAIINGTLIATEIKSEDGDIKVHAMVSSVDLDTSTFKLSPVTGQPEITVTVTSSTQLEDDVTDIEPYTLTNLFNNLGFVEVRGYEDGSGGITAVEIDVKEVSKVVVQGNASAAKGTAAAGGTITVLGITFNFDGTTDFENESDVDLLPSEVDALISDINNTLTAPRLIKVEDKEAGDGNPVGTADEIDIETP